MPLYSKSIRELQTSMSTNSLPSLPGTQHPQPLRQNYHKSQRFQVTHSGSRVEQDCEPVINETLRKTPVKDLNQIYKKKNSLLCEWDELRNLEKIKLHEAVSCGKSLKISESQPMLRVPPNWVKHDREVLRFHMYFKEAVHESAAENYRVRKCILYYYLADQKIQIEEPKEQNSGLPQGVFLKKTTLKKSDGSLYSPEDFLIGTENTIYGRTFRVTDCDLKTREHFQEKGIQIGAAEECPEDPHRRRQRKSDEKGKTVVESIAGGKRPDNLGKYLKNDSKVLRFNCLWDDTHRLYGEKNEYSLHYFLSDDTIEVRNKVKKGSDPFPLLLKRQKLLRDMHEPERGTYLVEDLRCGEFIDCYKRKLLLVSCDDYTRKYYERIHGIDQPTVKIAEAPRPIPITNVPPYNGFGSEADSLANCLNLVAKPVKMNLQRFLSNRGKTLRFKAKFLTAGPEDSDRSFVITYYMDDDTCAIYEPPKRNSGIVGGKFLERGKYKLPIREKAKKREISELEQHVLDKIQASMVGGPYTLLRAFRQFGTGEDGCINMDGFTAGLRSIGVLNEAASDEQINELYSRYDNSGDGRIDFKEFVEHVMQDKDVATNETNYSTRWIRGSDFYVGAILQFVFPQTGARTQPFELLSATESTLELMEMHKEEFPKSNVDIIFANLATTLREYGIRVREIFNNIDGEGKGWISSEQFLQLLNKWAMDFGYVEENFTEQEKLTIMRRYDYDGDGRIRYREFCDAVMKTKTVVEADRSDEMIAIFKQFLDGVKTLGDLKAKFKVCDEKDTGKIVKSDFKSIVEQFGNLSERDISKLMMFLDKDSNGYVDFNEFLQALEQTPKSVERVVTSAEPRSNIMEYTDILEAAKNSEDPQNGLLLLMKSFTATFYNRAKLLRKTILAFDLDRVGTIGKQEFVEALYRSNPDFSNKDRNTLLNYLFSVENTKLDYNIFMDIMFSQDTRKAIIQYGQLR